MLIGIFARTFGGDIKRQRQDGTAAIYHIRIRSALATPHISGGFPFYPLYTNVLRSYRPTQHFPVFN